MSILTNILLGILTVYAIINTIILWMLLPAVRETYERVEELFRHRPPLNEDWFGPLQPLPPTAPRDQEPRRLPYKIGDDGAVVSELTPTVLPIKFKSRRRAEEEDLSFEEQCFKGSREASLEALED